MLSDLVLVQVQVVTNHYLSRANSLCSVGTHKLPQHLSQDEQGGMQDSKNNCLI